MHPALTPRQQALFDCLRDRFPDGAPNLQTLCDALGLRSRGSLHKQLMALVAAGLVEPAQRRHRGIRLTPQARLDANSLPLLGYIAAGHPIEALGRNESVEVPAALKSGQPCYVLEVRGDSMIEAGIMDGDRVVIEQREQARNGEVVVALIDESEATLKRIEQRPGQVLLHAANADYAPLSYPPDRVRIQGVLVGLMRRY